VIDARPAICLASAALLTALLAGVAAADTPLAEPLVARVEMKLAVGEQVIDVIEQGDLLTVLEEREEDYVILTHDGSKGAIDKVNAVPIAESGEIYSELILRNPQEGRYYTLRAGCWWALGKADKALEDFDKAIELGYREAHAYTSRGLFHAEIGNYEAAIADYNEALQIDTEDLSPLVNRAAVYMSQGEFLKAAADYTRVLEDREGSTTLLHQRAIAYKSAGKLADAAADFDAILQQNPDDYAALMGRGYVRFQQQQHGHAVADFSAALERNPQDAVAFNNRGYNRFQLGQYTEAVADYKEAIRLAPTYSLALQNLAWLLATAADEAVRDPAAAVEAARRSCELTHFERVGDLSALAAALAADGKFEEAIGWQEKVIERVGDAHKEFAGKLLARYENERPFATDPDRANAEEQAAAEAEAKAEAEAEAEAEAKAKADADAEAQAKAEQQVQAAGEESPEV
jgi:tetratricopeptide (TPR) repeat protein